MNQQFLLQLHACIEALCALVFVRWRVTEGGLADLLAHGATLKPARELAAHQALGLAAIAEEMADEVTPPIGLAELALQLSIGALDRNEENEAAEQLRAWLRELAGHGADGQACACSACTGRASIPAGLSPVPPLAGDEGDTGAQAPGGGA
jgi:hypothetical protein